MVGVMLAAAKVEASPKVWLAIFAGAMILIGIDYVVPGRRAQQHPWWAAAAGVFWLLFGLGLTFVVAEVVGPAYGPKYLTGFLVEKALVFEQIVAFALLLKAYDPPEPVSIRDLRWAVLLALVLRVPFILLGGRLAEVESPIVPIVLAVLFVIGAYELIVQREAHDHDASRTQLARLFRRFVPVTGYVDDQILVRRGGHFAVTAGGLLLVALLTADLYFAVVVPVAFAFGKPPVIVWLSSAASMLGFRSTWNALERSKLDLAPMKIGVGLLMCVVAADLVLEIAYDFPDWVLPSLSVVLVLAPLGWSMVAYLLGFGGRVAEPADGPDHVEDAAVADAAGEATSTG